MAKAKIKLVTIGHLPRHLDLQRVANWKSDLFELAGEIEKHTLLGDSDGDGWEFSDERIKEQLPPKSGADFLVALVNVPIEDNYYSRRLGDNQVVFTFNQIREFLASENIPLHNAVLRVLYAYTLLYRRAGNQIPPLSAAAVYTHDETRGCLFDMNGIKSDLIESCSNPQLCTECEERLSRDRVPTQTIRSAQNEMRRIQKNLYYRVFDFVKVHPKTSLLISSLFALALGVIGSLIASLIYDGIKPMLNN